MIRKLSLIGFALVSLAGCGRVPAPVPEDPARPPSAASVESTREPAVDPAGCTFCAVPDEVRVCDVYEGVKTRLHWHLADQGVDVVNFYVVDEAGIEQPFAQQGVDGEMDSGAWLRPGLIFRIKDDRTGQLLGEIVISGVDC